MKKWTRAIYQPNLPLDGKKRVTASPANTALSRRAAREGMVLLKNDGPLLPLASGTRVALFGKGSFDYVKGGGGSGDVTVAYVKVMIGRSSLRFFFGAFFCSLVDIFFC